MSKAILVMNMPNNCNECPCEYDYLHCKAYESLYRKRSPSPNYDEKPKWCPLKEVPSKIPQFFQNKKCFSDKDKGCFQGWNDCLEEIIGDEDGNK